MRLYAKWYHGRFTGTVSGSNNIGVSSVPPTEDTSAEEIAKTIYIDDEGKKQSKLYETPTHDSIEFVEGYLNGSLNSIVDLVSTNTVNSYVKYDVVYYISTFVVDKAGNVSEDVRIIHIVNRTNSGVVVTTSSGVNTYTITQGASFNLPELIATITDFHTHTMTDVENYNVFFEYNGRRVDTIDTTLVGTYKVYAQTNVDGDVITQLVYTLNVEDGYVEVVGTTGNYAPMIILIIMYMAIIAAAIYIQKRKKII